MSELRPKGLLRVVSLAMGLLGVALSGCGGGGGADPVAPPAAAVNTVAGVASKGPLSGATLCAYAITAGVKGAAVGSCVQSSATGAYTLDLGSYTGPVLLEATGGSYVDEATGSTVTLASPLRSVLPNFTGGNTSAAVTALTELAYQLAAAQTGGLTTANVQGAQAEVQSNFGLADILATQPVDALSLPASATADQKAYALALATVSQYLKGQPAGATLAGALQTIQACLSATGNCGSLATDLASAMSSFQAAHAGYTGLGLPAAGFGGNTGGGGLSCNTAHYQAGAVHQPTSTELASFAKTYTGNTGSYSSGSWVSNGGSASFVLSGTGGLTYNGAAQTVNSICADNTIAMLYVEFGGTGAVDLFADGAFNGNLPDLTGVNGNPGGTGSSTPAVASYAPSSGAVGTTVTISGSDLGHFTPAPLVKFGATTATVSSATATAIVVTVPAGLTAGNSAITLSNFDGTGVVSVGDFTVAAAGGSGNTTIGSAANGTPTVDPSQCGTVMSAGAAGPGLTENLALKCAANAVADFANVTVVDKFSDLGTCTASYSNGLLTVSKGALSASVTMNGEANDAISTWVSSTAETIKLLAPVTIAASGITADVAKVGWKPDGTPSLIQGGTTAIGGSYQLFTCMIP